MGVEIVDPDVDPPVPEPFGRVAVTVAAVSVGGVVGALARYGLTYAWPSLWTTFAINVAGCLLIGVLMVFVAGAHHLVRPFLGVGVLGGFTTFSAYAEQSRALLAGGQSVRAFGYLAGTLVAAVVAVHLGRAAAERVR